MDHIIELYEKEKIWFWITVVAGLMISSVCYAVKPAGAFYMTFYAYGISLVVLLAYEFIRYILKIMKVVST